eukprot:Amastigsp_a683390_13.p1 type:complete len:500 gc:universal Amastigsp_a683390_13:24-1523(+)
MVATKRTSRKSSSKKASTKSSKSPKASATSEAGASPKGSKAKGSDDAVERPRSARKSSTKRSGASASPVADKGVLQPVTHEFEFGGPLGAGLVIIALPLIVVALNLACGRHGLLTLFPLSFPHVNLDELLGELFTVRATGLVFGWFVWHMLLYVVLPGEVVDGLPMRNGKTLKYTMNGRSACVISVLGVTGLWWYGLFDLAALADQTVPLASASILLSVMLSVYVYVASFGADEDGAPKLLAAGGNSGNPVYDFFIGRELNPRVLGVDLKFVCELRPGMIGWLVLNAAYLMRQHQRHGQVSNSMYMVVLFQSVYVLDALLNESAILSTMDITTDGYGFMLVFGCLSWVPFTYSLQAHYLRYHPVELAPLAFGAILVVMMLGYWIFRAANSTKDLFRANPSDERVSHISFINTARGTRLMTSGWWGLARHINYLGDWIMAWAWCLPTGFATPVTYFYVIYFAVLLIHRDRRDDANCAVKYGADWETYTSMVPWRIIPYVY